MKFDFVPAAEFYEFLYSDLEFCAGLGKVMLAAGRLETAVRACLRSRGVPVNTPKATLGSLTETLKNAGLLTTNGEMVFGDLVRKRNYLAHSLFDLFSGQIEETILERQGLIKEDLHLFRERVDSLASDFMHFVSIVNQAELRDGVVL